MYINITKYSNKPVHIIEALTKSIPPFLHIFLIKPSMVGVTFLLVMQSTKYILKVLEVLTKN